MKGVDVINQLKRKLGVQTDAKLGSITGTSVPSIQNWKRRRNVTALQVATLVSKAIRAGAAAALGDAINTIVEFYPIEPCDSRNGAKLEIFSTKTAKGVEHPYRSGLRSSLEARRGVYVFFDSRGRAIYVGKAERQNLWREMNNVLNRDRGDIQRIRRVGHPQSKVKFSSSDERHRQIVKNNVPLHEIAHYVSAYEVSVTMIDDVEALLMRSFANDLLNSNLQRFTRTRRTS